MCEHACLLRPLGARGGRWGIHEDLHFTRSRAHLLASSRGPLSQFLFPGFAPGLSRFPHAYSLWRPSESCSCECVLWYLENIPKPSPYFDFQWILGQTLRWSAGLYCWSHWASISSLSSWGLCLEGLKFLAHWLGRFPSSSPYRVHWWHSIWRFISWSWAWALVMCEPIGLFFVVTGGICVIVWNKW